MIWCQKFKVAIILFPLLIVSIIPSADAQNDGRLKVGVVVALSGNLASVGWGIKNAIILADQEYDQTNKVEFIFEDDQFDPKQTVSAVNKLLDRDGVRALIILGSSTSLAVKGIAEQKKIPMIALATAKEVRENAKYVMTHWLTAKSENEVLVAEVNKRGFKKIAVVTSNQDGMLALRDLFKNKMGDRIGLNLEFLPSDIDFRTAASKIKASKPDAVYNLLLPGQCGLFSKQLRQAGYNGDLFAAHQPDDWKEVVASDMTLVGSWFVSFLPVSDGGFRERYVAAYHENPNIGAANGYDSARLFIAWSGNPDLNTYLHQLKDFDGALGKYSAHPEGYFDLPAVLKKVTATGFEALYP